MFTLLWPLSASLNSHDYGLQVCTTTASKCISKLARSMASSPFARSDVRCTNIQWYQGWIEWWGVYIGQTPEHIDITSFPFYLIIQLKYTLYGSQVFFSLALSQMSWIHTVLWILNARYYYIFLLHSYTPGTRTTVTHDFGLDIGSGGAEVNWVLSAF